jgi:hypothetical protein
MLWRALTPGAEPRTQILLPPLKWSPQPDDAQAPDRAGHHHPLRPGHGPPARHARERRGGPRPADALARPARGDLRRFDDEVVATIVTRSERVWG